MSTFKLITLLAFTLLFICCDKDKTVDPQATDPNTANSFSCYVNGVYWEAQAPFTWGGPVAVEGEFIENIGYLSLNALQKKVNGNIYESITLFTYDIKSIGNYTISTGQGSLVGYLDYYEKDCYKYYFDTINPGIMTVSKFDKINRLISGTFSMTLKNPDCGPDSLM